MTLGRATRRGRDAPTLLLMLLLTGCAQDNGSWGPADVPPEAVSISFHLAYDEPRDGLREMTDHAGEKVYVSPQIELSRTDIADARALHSAEHSMLQLVLTRFGAERLYALTRDHPGDRVAVIINDKLACAPRIYQPVASGEIRIVGVFSRTRTEELARALSRRDNQ